jgi:acyl-CoA synthetase (AMP-forming)/AMP-acid ligase II
MHIRIVDPESGQPLPTGATGEITVKGVTLMRGYYKVPPEECLDDEGWFHTQDAGYLDDQGYLHWTGRMSGLIKTAGANVSPIEVEFQVAQLGVFGVTSVVGVPHPSLGEVVVMCSVPLRAAQPDIPEVLGRLRQNLASYKIPKRVLLFSDAELAFTSSDKLQLDQVRRLAAERIIATDDDEAWVAHLRARYGD